MPFDSDPDAAVEKPSLQTRKAQTRRAKRRRKKVVRRLVMAAAVVLMAIVYIRWAPDNYNLTAPLDLTDRPTIVTEWKLQLAGAESCYGALQQAGLSFERLPDEVKGPGCEFVDVARLDDSLADGALARWGTDVTLNCQMLAGLALWERHTLQPLAQELFGSKIARVRHYGTYSCRNVNNASHGRRSEHATANAVDVAGFVLADGQEISVLADWGKGTAKSRFLDRIHDRACKHFNTVLGPDYNRLHSDHFHFDQGNYETCR